MLQQAKPLVVIPTYNEAGNLHAVVAAIHDALPEAAVLIVDDASPDGTGRLADALAARHPWLAVLHRSGKQGLATAYAAGFRHALERDVDRVFTMDADFSHDPRYLPALLAATDQADLVIGSRYVPGGRTPDWGLARRLISGCGNVCPRYYRSSRGRRRSFWLAWIIHGGGRRRPRGPRAAGWDDSWPGGDGRASPIRAPARRS
jgi:dolichol-phosphate mannosyltransferase